MRRHPTFVDNLSIIYTDLLFYRLCCSVWGHLKYMAIPNNCCEIIDWLIIITIMEPLYFFLACIKGNFTWRNLMVWFCVFLLIIPVQWRYKYSLAKHWHFVLFKLICHCSWYAISKGPFYTGIVLLSKRESDFFSLIFSTTRRTTNWIS